MISFCISIDQVLMTDVRFLIILYLLGKLIILHL